MTTATALEAPAIAAPTATALTTPATVAPTAAAPARTAPEPTALEPTAPGLATSVGTAPAPVAPAPAGPVLLSRIPAVRPHLRLLRHEPDPDLDDDTHAVGPARPAATRRPLPPAPKDLHPTPDLRRRAHQVLRLVLEVLDGRRPPTHLAAHLEPSALRYVRAARGSRPRGHPPTHLTSLHVSRPTAGAVEVAAVHRTGGRTRVLAARLEGRPDDPDRWRCCTLRLL